MKISELSPRAKRNAQWIENHCIIPDGRLVGQKVKLTPAQLEWLEMIYGGPTRMFILSIPRKNGKALALDTPIPTPTGWKTMGEITVGDYVYDTHGNPVRVIGESEIFKDKECYKVTFSDGSSIVASEDHLWTTKHKYRPWAKPSTYANGKIRGKAGGRGRDPIVNTITTKQIYQSLECPRADGGYESNHKIQIAKLLKSNDIKLPINPYLFGLWLGDGTSSCASFTCGAEDIDFMVNELNKRLANNVIVSKYKERAYTIRATKSGLQKTLRKNNLLNNKHIPEIYFNAGHKQRLELLQGLMDADGTVSKHGGKTTPRCSFTNKNHNIAYGVWRLARSLGLKATIIKKPAKLNGVVISDCWAVSFSATLQDNVFKLERKNCLLPISLSKRSYTLTIVACEPIGVVETKCIAVDSLDHLYLAGHGCVPTHNTAFSAMIMLLHLCGPEAVQSGQLYSTANSRDQASVLFNLAAKMVRLNHVLSQYVVVRDSKKELECKEIGTIYKALSADASTAMGLSPSLHLSDESGQIKGPTSDLFDALETASAAQANPLTIVISTQAATDGDFLSILIDDALKGDDPRIKVKLYAVPKDKDPFDPIELAKAQPNWHLMNQEEVLKMATDAKRMPSREASFRNLVANQRVEASNPFVTASVWEKNSQYSTLKAGDKVWCGLDLSAVNDLTALVMVGEDGSIEPHFWLPKANLIEKAKNDRVPYDDWYSQGILRLVEGNSITYDAISVEFRVLFNKFDVQKVAFDRWNMVHLIPCLIRAGFTQQEIDEKFVEFGQGTKSMSPAIRTLESLLLDGQLRHGDNPILKMCAANAVTVCGDAGESDRKFTKRKSSGRIDGMVALAMAIGVMPEISDKTEFDRWVASLKQG